MKKHLKTVALLLAFIVILSFAGCKGNSDKIVIEGVDISGKSRAEAIELLKEKFVMDDKEEAVILVNSEKISFSAKEIGAVYDYEKAVDMALGETADKGEYNLLVKVDEKLLDKKLAKVEKKVVQPTAVKTDEGILVTNGVSGFELDREKLLTELGKEFSKKGKSEIEVPFVTVAPEKIDCSTFFASVESEFKDFGYIRNEDGTIAVIEGNVGVIVDKVIAEKEVNLHTKEGESYIVPCTVQEPEFTKEELETRLFGDVLATYSTSYSTSSANRASNVELATSSISGVVLLPGEEFSFNGSVGKRTAERGYKSAGAYVGGKTVQEIGGGICQVSSTLYNTVLLSNLEIVERRSHQMTVAYVPVGRDATVNWGTTDFRFKNNTKFPVKISGHWANRKLTIDMLGTQADENMKVEIVTSTVSVLEPADEIEYDPGMSFGTTKTEKGSRGYVVDASRIVYSGDVKISSEALTRSRYNPSNNIIKVGTMVPQSGMLPIGTTWPEGIPMPDGMQMPPVEQPVVETPVDVPVDTPVEVPVEVPAEIPTETTSDNGL